MGHLQPDPAAAPHEGAGDLSTLELDSQAAPPWAGFDAVIDVRSPAEFAEDHIPGAISLPVLSNDERARVGTIYTQESPFAARKIGAALVARNAARHIEEHLMDHDGAWRPLVYCWRGGQRSGSFATILRQIGWRAETLAGGYQSYRRAVVAALYDGVLPLTLYRLDGFTGTAKTAVLARLGALGVQVIDLEGLACHRGSALGDVDGAQPAQKGFESVLLAEVLAMDPSRPVLVEAESARIGALRLPPALWSAMRAAPRLVIEAPVSARAAYLAEAYRELAQDAEGLAARLDKLRPLVGHGTVGAWLQQAQDGAHVALAQGLIERHYDPAYARARASDAAPVVARFQAESLGGPGLDDLAQRIAAAVQAA